MNVEAQRIAIVQACPDLFIWNADSRQVEWAPVNPCGYDEAETDPLGDLNAIHEAEKALTEDQWSVYCVKLNELVCRIKCRNLATCGYTIAATAAQRAEAFLRTLKLWKEAA